MKNLIVLLFVGLTGMSCLGVVAAQELLVPPPASEVGDNVPELALPAMPDPAQEGDEMGDAQVMTTPEVDSWESGDFAEQLEPYVSDDCQLLQCDAAVLESTGTWIRRGFWYAEVDTVIFKRKFNRDPIALIEQPVGVSSNPFQPGTVENQLLLRGDKPAAEAVPRFTLGHFLFRDHHNRDHVGEFTIYGGGEWTQQSQLDVNLNNDLGSTTLFVPVEIDEGNLSFDGATSSQFSYTSRFNSYEFNYHVKERMGRDHVEMDPSGHWVRRAGPSMSRSLLAGIRYFDLSEDFSWEASGIDRDNNAATPADIGNVRTFTDNDMIGTQLGVTWFFETARWSGGIRAKGGMFINVIDVRVSSVIPTTTNPVVTDSALDTEELGFVGEVALLGKWHLRPNFSLRAGVEMLYVTSTALAPAQMLSGFLPSGPTSIVSSGDPAYLGATIGFEGYW